MGKWLAADLVKKYLPNQLWHNFFRSHFAVKLDQIDPASLALPHAVWTLRENVIMLNYEQAKHWHAPRISSCSKLG